MNERFSRLRRRLAEAAPKRVSPRRKRPSVASAGEDPKTTAARRREQAQRATARARRERESKAPTRPRRMATPGASSAIRALVARALELGRRLLAIPAGWWLALAELVGRAVLRLYRVALRPVALAAASAVRAVYRFAKVQLTPARAVAAVALVALVALAASQWLDYRSISVGTSAYADGLDAIAAAPEVRVDRAGDAHSWAMVPLAVAGLAALGWALLGHPWAARLLLAVGAAVLVIALAIDAPKGLDEGEAAIVYDGAVARLLEGFWVQVGAGAVLVACGLLLPAYLRRRSSAVRAPGAGAEASTSAGRGRGRGGRIGEART